MEPETGKPGGASSDLVIGRLSGKSESASCGKELSDFCDHCRPLDCMRTYTITEQRGKFMDRLGLMWVCDLPLTCPHAIINNGRIHSCMVRSAQIRNFNRGRPDGS